MNIIFRNIVLICVVLGSIAGAYAADDNFASVRGGKLVVAGEINDMKLFLNGKKLRDGNGFSLSIEKKFAVGSTDVVLMMNNSGGVDCPAQYFFVSVSTQGAAKLSPEFGTCSDLAKSIQSGSKITITMPERTSRRGMTKYVFENGVVTEIGKPAK